MKSVAISSLTLMVLSVSAFAEGTLPLLHRISDNAEVGNGGSSVKTYQVDGFNESAALKKDLQTVKRDFSNCGPYKTTTYRRDSIEALRKFTGDAKTADALSELYHQDKISKMYTIQTNQDVDCSRMWAEIYMTDGGLLELYYGLND